MSAIQINGKDVSIVEYKNERVVTFAMIDEIHGRPDGTARKRFNDNKEHFAEGEDYFDVGSSEIRTHNICTISDKSHGSIKLITESGYLMLVKSFTDDLAWQVQKQLVKGYFKAKEFVQSFDPMQALGDPTVLRNLLLGYSEKVTALETKVEEMTPAVQAYDRLAKADGTLCLTDAAKALQMRPKDFIAKLQVEKWIYKRTGSAHWLGYQEKVQQGLLEHKLTEVTRGDGTTKITEQVRVTAKGLAKLAK